MATAQSYLIGCFDCEVDIGISDPTGRLERHKGYDRSLRRCLPIREFLSSNPLNSRRQCVVGKKLIEGGT